MILHTHDKVVLSNINEFTSKQLERFISDFEEYYIKYATKNSLIINRKKNLMEYRAIPYVLTAFTIVLISYLISIPILGLKFTTSALIGLGSVLSLWSMYFYQRKK